MDKDNSIYVVGGGPSLKGFDFNYLKDKKTIAVNASISDIPDPDYFITMDYTFVKANTPKLIETTARKYFVVNYGATHNGGPRIKTINGRPTDTFRNITYYINQFNEIASYCTIGFGETDEQFCHGNNSGHCAIQLAIIKGYKNIYLLGIDMSTKKGGHYYKTNDERIRNNVDEYYNNFVESLPYIPKDVNLYSCSPISRLNEHIPYVKLDM